jgi:hypothetical protein
MIAVGRFPDCHLGDFLHRYTTGTYNYCQSCGSESEIQDQVLFDPRSRNPTNIFESLVTIFGKRSLIFFLQLFKNKIIFNLWNLWLQKSKTTNFSPVLFFVFVGSGISDPGSAIRDPRSRMEKNLGPGFGIQDKHSWTATLITAC